MYDTLTPRRSKALALAILTLSALLILFTVFYPAWSLNRHYEERISEQQHQILLYQRLASQAERYQSEYSRLKRLRLSDRRYLQSETDSLAKAELQRRVKQVVSSGNGEILSTQVVHKGQQDGFSRVAIRVRMKITLQDSVTIFHKLENEKPYLFVDEVTIRSRPLARRRLPATAEILRALELLDIDFRLVGYMKSLGS